MANKGKSDNNILERRKAIKKIGVAGGVVATSSVLPNTWIKPIVQSVVLPVHAQSSCAGPALWSLSFSLQGDPTSGSEETFNLDFVVQTPNGGVLQPPVGSETATLRYTEDLGLIHLDRDSGFRRTDYVRQKSDADAQCGHPSGTYRIFVRATETGHEYPTIRIRVRARGDGGEDEQIRMTDHFTSSGWRGDGPPDDYQVEVATVTFPAGTISFPALP